MISYIRGHVKIKVRGRRLEEFLNECSLKKIITWDVRYRGSMLELHIHLSDVFRLRPLLRQTGCRMHVVERQGLPFFLVRMERRKFFAAGLLLFVLGMYLLSSIVWSVQVTGTDKIPKHEVLEAAKKHGIYALQWKFKLDDPAELSRDLLSELPGATWIGVEMRGTQVQIEVVEAAQPEKQELLSPRHIVSSADAVVTEIFAERGKPLVEPNVAVKKGDILISGIIGNLEDPEDQATVAAKGEVKGLVLYEYRIEIPLTLKYKVYTGQWHTRNYAVVGNRGLQVTGYGGPKYEHSEVITERNGVQWRNFKLPFGWMEEKVMEVEYAEEKLAIEDAREIALQQATSELKVMTGPDSEIVEHKILHEKTENGKVYMKALFEVNQSITDEMIIVPESTDQGE